jgi:hypothetical protein
MLCPLVSKQPVLELISLAAVVCTVLSAGQINGDDEVVRLPPGVQAIWDLDKAYRETTATRERISINGLWRWQPTTDASDQVPRGNWGYFKVPGCWPGITDYLQKDSQTVYPHPAWKKDRLAEVSAAWYEREINVPASWNDRRISLSLECLNSYAAVYVDGREAGEIKFPAGELDLTTHCRPGATHVLSMFVVAMPLKAVLLSYNDTNTAREVKGRVARRGLCGDVYLVGTPRNASISDVKVDTSVRKGEVTFDAALERLAADQRYLLRARISLDGRQVREFDSPLFTAADARAGRIAFSQAWQPDHLWDIDTPQNVHEVELALLDARRNVLDTFFGVRFGYREFWIDGRDFYLNGTRIFLSCVPLDNAQISAAQATYDAVRESLERLKSIGINFVYTHHYGCEPGSHLSLTEVLRAADDVGMLVAVSQPHFAHYEWQRPEADLDNGYALHAEFHVRTAQNHPSVVAYAMSHNATGYDEDMNPDLIDGTHDSRSAGEIAHAAKALRAEAIVKRLDPGRIVYHHSSGNLGSMHTSNFYPNFVPIQELSDWFEHWATEGVKPVFMCEYGAPFSWDWAMYRGWYEGQRSFGSARVPWDFCLAEWNSQFIGDAAFRTSEDEKANLRWEANQFKTGNGWHRWDYPQNLNSKRFDDRYPIIARYLTDNWRAFRTWGVSAISPWEHEQYWKLREGVDRGRRELAVDWQRLQRPGFSPDYLAERYERMDLAFERTDWLPTDAAHALLRNNLPLLAYIAGKPGALTGKDHNFLPDEAFEKQAIVVNNSRRTIMCDCSWSLALPEPIGGSKRVEVPAGGQARVPLRVELPRELAAGEYELKAHLEFSDGQSQEDSLAIDVLLRPAVQRLPGRVALFDPRGETKPWLKTTGTQFDGVEADANLAGYDVLIVGKGALSVEGPAPDLSRVRDGLRVVVFEQTAEALEKRLGFRVVEYGLRQVFPRVPDHPLLSEIDAEHWRDWRGEATLLPPRLKYELRPRHGPTVLWCDIPVSRLWRCGNRGNVASVLIEKPARGNFLPVVDGGFSLQYSPLLEHREGRGMVLFCQVDVTTRTEPDPAAETLLANIMQYVAHWKPAPTRRAVYAGDPAGQDHLASCGVATHPYVRGKLSGDDVLVVGPGGGRSLAADAGEIGDWLGAGGHLLAIGLDESDADFLRLNVGMRKSEHISAYFERFGVDSPLVGVGPADVQNRDPRELPLIASGATAFGDGVLAMAEKVNVVFCQIVPWQFGPSKQLNLRKTYRRASFLLTRLLANMGVVASTPIIERFHRPVDAAETGKRWQEGMYLDQPEEWDDPYRFFRW